MFKISQNQGKHIKSDEISTLLDGETAFLGTERTEYLRSHLKSCASCQQRYQQFAALQKHLHALPRVSIPEENAEQVLERIRLRSAHSDAGAEHKKAEAFRPSRTIFGEHLHSLLRPVAAAAAAALIIAGTFVFVIEENQNRKDKETIETCLVEQETAAVIEGYEDIANIYTDKL